MLGPSLDRVALFLGCIPGPNSGIDVSCNGIRSELAVIPSLLSRFMTRRGRRFCLLRVEGGDDTSSTAGMGDDEGGAGMVTLRAERAS